MNRKVKLIPALYAVLGLVGCGLYRWLYTAGLDENSLLVRGTLPEILLWAVTACAILGAVPVSRRFQIGENGTILAIIGDVILATGIFSLLQIEAAGPSVLTAAYRAIILAAIACLLACAVMRILGRKPFFLLLIAPCALCVLQLLECYQLWSEKPLLLDYFFGVGAVLCLTLAAYHSLEAASNLPVKKLRVYSGIAGIFFCCVAAMQADFPIFFAAGALWLLVQCAGLTSPEA